MEGGGELGNLSLQLNLTPEQREKLRPILDEEGQQLHDVRIDEHVPPDVKACQVDRSARQVCSENRCRADPGAVAEIQEAARESRGEAVRHSEGRSGSAREVQVAPSLGRAICDRGIGSTDPL